MNTIQTISFNGQNLTAIQQNDKIYVAMKSICENIGLDWEAQRQKIQRNQVLNSVACMLKATAKDGKTYETMCLPLGFLSGWLMGIEVNRVKPEIRETLIQYQIKCYDVLHNYFMPKLSGSLKPDALKTQTALPNGLTLEQQDEIKKLHRELVQTAPKEKQAKLAIQLWSSVKSKFGVSYKEVAPEHYPEVLSLMARVAVENATLTGELLDKPIQSTVRLEEFELIRVMAFLSNRYMEMQTASCVARAIYTLNPQMAKNMKSEFDRDFPLLKGIAHTFQRFSGSLKDPLCAKEFEMHAKYLQGANLAW